MSQKLKITELVKKRFETVKTECSGYLYGVMYEGAILIVGFSVQLEDNDNNYKLLQNHFPAEVDLYGLIKFGSSNDAEEQIKEAFQDVDVTDNPILLHCELGTTVGLKASIVMHGQLQDIPFETMSDEELWENFIHTRLKCHLDVICEENESSIQHSIQTLRKKLSSGIVGFNIRDTPIYLFAGDSGSVINGISTNATMTMALNASQGEGEGMKPKKKSMPTEFEQLKIVAFIKKTEDNIGNFKNSATKVVFNQSEDKPERVIPLQIDTLAMLHKNTRISSLYDILIESVCRALRLIERSILNQLPDLEDNSELSIPVTYHFLPPDIGHFITCCYSSGHSDKSELLTNERRTLHKYLNLKLIRPYFTRANNNVFKCDLYGEPLVNVHVGVKAQNLSGKDYLVAGKYSYYHYMQQQFDDNGWGCAYRSLQTLCSWFKWQGYSDVPIPTHKEIQQVLVDSGDKTKNFIGSKQWIGSTEVSIVLNSTLGIDSKILFVRTGSEMSTIGPELAVHFEIQGTPIMIGGGVLAHTILGVNYNNETGDLKFLILDPHYTGADDLQIIHNKGWCGWKGVDFWDKKAYYNLCLPQRPINF